MVTYITENLLRKCTDSANPFAVTKLNLSGRGNDHKIRVIENLHAFVNLVSLNLSDNEISKIENLEKLIRLKHLNLSKNKILRFNGLERLSQLVTLNLSDNLLTVIPLWISKKLPLLKTFHLSGNRVGTLHQLLRLRDLNNLTELSFHGNPAVDQLILAKNNTEPESRDHNSGFHDEAQTTYRLFVLFHLRTLIVLDGKEVRPEDRRQSDSQFSQAEFTNMSTQLGQQDLLTRLVDTSRENAVGSASAEQNAQATQISKLQQELSIKDSLLQSKSDELARACLKHYELERELAFHNIDTKISRLLLGPRPRVDGTSSQQIDSTGEQPYIGRCRPRVPHSGSCQLLKPDSDLGDSWGPIRHMSTPKLPVHDDVLLCKRTGDGKDTGVYMSPLPATFSSMDPLNGPCSFPADNPLVRPVNTTQQTDELERPSSAPSGSKQLVPCSDASTLNGQSVGSHCLPSSFSDQLPFFEQDINTHRALPALCEVERLSKLLFQGDSADPKHQYAKSLIEKTLSGLRAQLCHTECVGTVPSLSVPFSSPPSGRRHDSHDNAGVTRSESALGFYWNEVNVYQPSTPFIHPSEDGVISASGRRSKLGQLCIREKRDSDTVNIVSADCYPPPFPSLPSAGTRERASFSSEFSAPSSSSAHRRYEVPSTNSALPLKVESDACLKPVPGLDDQFKFASPMQHSTTSSAPSSRTTGTGRSVIHPETLQHKSLSDACRQDTDFARRSMQSNIKSSSPTVFRNKDSFDNWSPRSTSPTDKLHLPLRPKTSASFRLPGVGDVCPVDSSSLSQDSATDSSDGDLPNVADVTHARLIDGGQPRSHKRRFYSRKHNFSIKDGQSHIQFPRTKRSVDCSSDEASVEDHKPPPPSVYLAINKNTHDSNARSITSVIDPIYRHGEYKNPFPVTLNKSPDRIQRPQRTTERRASTGTLDEHVEQFLEMLSKSYGLRASKVGKLRASLNQVLKMIPDAVPSADESSPALPKRDSHLSFIEMGDGVARSSSRSRSGELLSGRGAAHSYGDTFTNVSRPSPFDYDGGSCDHLDFTTTPQASRPGDRLPPQHHQPPVSSFHSRLVPAPFEPHDEPNEFCNLSTGPGNHRLDSDPRTSARATQREHRRSFKAGRSQHEDGLPDQKYPVYQPGPHCFTYAPKSNPHLAPRGHSADPHRLRTEAVETVENGEDEDPGTETTALLDLTQELLGLRRGLKRTRQLNSGRLQTALKHISLLEMELQRQRCLTHDAQNACARQQERSRWEKHLASVLSELKQCQANIGTLQAQLDSWEADRTDFARSRFRLDNQQKELDRARSALGHQRKEISRLNSLLNHLLGVHPTDASPEDLQQLQTGLVELNRLVQVLRSDQSINSSQVRRAQSMQAGLTTGADPHAPSNPRYPPVIDVMRDFPGSLFCNVPEHHSIEDSLATARQRVHALKASQKDIQKKLRQASNVRSKLESQLEEQSAEINRLTTEVSVKQKKTCQSNADLSSLETSVRDRRDELTRLEEKIKLSETQLRTSEAQADEVSAHRDRLNTERVQLTTELDALRLDAQRAKDQLGQAKDALQQAQCDVDSMATMKQKFQLALTTLEQTVTTKEAELQSLSAQVTEVQNNLKRLGLEVDEGEHRIQSQRLLFSENETAVLKQQADLRRLAQQIEESQSRLIALAREAGEQRSQVDLIRLEKHREIGNSVSNSLELTTKTAAQQRELFETQSLLNSCLTEKAQVVTSIEALKAERDQLHSEIRQKQESLDEITSSLDQFKTELEDLADAKRSEETRLNDLFAQQRELVTQLDELRAQAREESERLRARDRNTSQKISEAESDRVELQRLATERKTVEAELSKLREDRDMIGSHLDRLKHKLDELERKEPVLIEAITKAKLELAQLRTNTQLESECLRQIQEDRATSQKEYDILKRQLEEQRSEVECIQKRMHSVNLNHELSSFDMAIRAEGTIKRTAGVQCMTGEFVSQGTPALPDKARHGNIGQNETRSTELCHSESSHTELKGSLSLATDDHSMKAARAAHSKTAAQHAPSEDKLDSGDVRSELARTKAALAVSQRSCKHLKRRAARELAELEQIAEDQCLRSAELTEQLALVKQQYAQLRRQINNYGLLMDEVITIASHTELSGHGRRLEAALTAVRAELDHTQLSGSQNEPNAGTHRNRPAFRVTQSSDELDQPFSSQHSGSSLNFHNAAYTHPLDLRRPGTSAQANTGTADSTYHMGTTATTSGLGSSLIQSNPTDANGSSQGTSALSLHLHANGRLTKDEWKRIFSSRVAQQRDQAAAEWEKASSRFQDLRGQVQEVRGKLDDVTVSRHYRPKQER